MFSKSFEDLKLIFFKTFLLKLSMRLFPREDKLNIIFVSSSFIAYFFKKIMFGSVPLIQSICCLLSTYILSDNTMFISQTITFFLHIGQNIFDHF